MSIPPAKPGNSSRFRLPAGDASERGGALVPKDDPLREARPQDSLWRGAPLADLAEELSLRGQIARLDELRLSAIERRIG